MSTTLSTQENTQLATLEAAIASGLDTFREVGKALCEIRDGKLYRANFKTFEAYCTARWQLSRNYADRIIAAADVTANLMPIGTKIPTTEAQARPLVKIDPPKRQEVWSEAVADAGDKQPTAAQVQKAADKVTGKTTPTRVVLDAGAQAPDYESESQEPEAEATLVEALVPPVSRVVSSRVIGSPASTDQPKPDVPFSGIDNSRKIRMEGELLAPAVLKKGPAAEWEMLSLHAVATRLLPDGTDAAAVVTQAYVVAIARR